MLQRGDRGEAVERLQKRLVALGFLSAADMATGPGIYGPKTEAAVSGYKATVVNGVADDRTLGLLGLAGSSTTPNINAVVDLSHHNKGLDLQQAADSGLKGIIHKATQGTRFKDPAYSRNREAAKQAGLLWGAYHFGNGQDPTAQADFFLEVAQPDGETLLVLDFESNPNGASMDLAGAVTFVSRIAEVTGLFPGFYSGHDIKRELGNNTEPTLANCWFWLAQYGKSAVVPANWPTWSLWQYTDGVVGPQPHQVEGIGSCDRNKFNGTEEMLHAFWQTNSV